MQNKAKSRKAQMNVNTVSIKDYEKRTLGERVKTNPNKANFHPKNQLPPSKQTQNKPKQTQFQRQKNVLRQCFCRKDLVESITIGWKFHLEGVLMFN
jgi:hypothetical protein